jgi:hypothetical protein
MGSGFKRGQGGDFTQRRDVGTTTSMCVHAARAGERLKEGRGLPSGPRGSAGQLRRAQRVGDGAPTGGAWGQRARASGLAPTSRSHWSEGGRAGPTGPKRLGGEGGLDFFCFSFYPKFPNPFPFIFSFEFKCNQTTNSNLNISSICIKQKSKV